MKSFKKFLAYLGLIKEPSIATITRPMATVAKKLEAFAEEQAELSLAETERADKLREQAEERAAAANEARTLSSRYSTLTV